MSVNPRRRWLILGSLLLLSVIAALFVDDGEEAPGEARQRSTSVAASQPLRPAVEKARRRSPEEASPLAALPQFPAPAAEEEKDEVPLSDPFQVISWVITPPPPPPPPPRAPALPFKYLGKLVDGEAYVVFLGQQNKNLIVREGDRLNGLYLVEQINGKRMVFRYEPLGQLQELAIGED